MGEQKLDSTNQLLEYRISQLEAGQFNILRLVQETHDVVTVMRAKMGDAPFQCNIHAERLSQMDKRISTVENVQEKDTAEQEKLKKFLYKTAGALGVILLLFNMFVGPLLLDWMKGKIESKPVIASQVITNR